MNRFLRLSLMMAAVSPLASGCAGGSWGASSGWSQLGSADHGRSLAGAHQPSAVMADPLAGPASLLEPTGSYGHLYVSAPLSHAVYRFPLVNGLPSQPPDATISGLTIPLGIATDVAGTLFVADDHVIKVFNNDAQGQPRLIRSLSTSFQTEEITVTRNGYMIVTANNGYLAIYRATASGNQPPIATLAPSGGQIYALASDANNTVYVTILYFVGIEAYPRLAPPPRHGTLHMAPARTIQPVRPYDFYYGLTVHNGQLFTRIQTQNPAPGVQYAVYPSNGNGPIAPTRIIATTACRPPYQGIAYGILISNDLLYQACDTPIGVFVYNSDARRAVPIGSVTGPFQGPSYLAFAP